MPPRGPDLAQQRRIYGKGLVGALQHHDLLLGLEQAGHNVAGERPEHRDVQDTHFELRLVPQVITHRFCIGNDRALAYDDVLGIIEPISGGASIVSARESLVFRKRLIR